MTPYRFYSVYRLVAVAYTTIVVTTHVWQVRSHIKIVWPIFKWVAVTWLNESVSIRPFSQSFILQRWAAEQRVLAHNSEIKGQ